MSAVPEAARRPRRWLAFLPLAAFALLAALLFVRLYAGDPSKLPSALIGESAPPLTLPDSTARRASPTPICGRATSASSTCSPRGASRAGSNTRT